MTEYGLIGEKLGHSFSKDIHSLIADYEYNLIELSPEELPAFLTEKNFKGVNVTIPYKHSVIPFLDEITPQARAIGFLTTPPAYPRLRCLVGSEMCIRDRELMHTEKKR